MKNKVLAILTLVCLVAFHGMHIAVSSSISVIGKGSLPGTLVHPSGFVFHGSNLLICDTAQSKIVAYDYQNNVFYFVFESYGDQRYQLKKPQSICKDDQNNVYISQQNQILKLDPELQVVNSFDMQGNFLDMVFYDGLLWICNYEDHEIIILDPENMRLRNRFSTGLNPVSLAFNSMGELLVSEYGENRISFYDQRGERIRTPLTLGRNNVVDGIAIGDDDLIYLHDSFFYQIHVYSRGGGRKIDEWELPRNTARCWKPGVNGMMWKDGKLFLSNLPTHEIIALDANGAKQWSIGKAPQADELLYPVSATIINSQIHVLDLQASNVKRYSLDGQALGMYGSILGRGRMDFPTGICVNADQQILILNAHSNVLFFNENGQFQHQLTVQTPLSCASDIVSGTASIYIADPGNQRVVAIDHRGQLMEEYLDLTYPSRLHLDNEQRLFVSDPVDASIKVFEKGMMIQDIQHPSIGKPGGMTTVDQHALLVADKFNHQIHLFIKDRGQFRYAKSFGSLGGPKTIDSKEDISVAHDPGKYAFPEDIIHHGFYVYVIDRMNQRIQKIHQDYFLSGVELPADEGIEVYPAMIDFGAIGPRDHPLQMLQLKKTGTQEISGSLEVSQRWIELSDNQFKGDSSIGVSVDPSKLSVGLNEGTINIDSNFATLEVAVRVILDEDIKTPGDPGVEEHIRITLQINHPKAIINGVEQWIDPDNPNVVPVILPPGRTFVPIRFISEAFGAKVEWDGETRSVRIFLEAKDVRITLQIDNVIARVGQETVTLDAPPQILNGRTFVPLRFIAEAFGADIQWDGATQSITIDLEL